MNVVGLANVGSLEVETDAQITRAISANGNLTVGNAITDQHTFTGHVTASHNISSSGEIIGTINGGTF
jgi:uncharacterized membrane protein